jgi:cell division protease FtsH
MNSTGQQTGRNSDTAPAGRFPPPDTKPGAPKGTGQAKMPPGRTWLWLLGILLANYLLMKFFLPSPDAPVTVPYTFFKKEVANRNVEAIHSQGEIITGRFKSPVTYPPAGEKSAAPGGQSKNATAGGATPGGTPKTVSNFTTTLPSFVDHGLERF